MDELYRNTNKIDKTDFIMHLNKMEQTKIRNALIRRGILDDDLERAMNSRICDLADTIPIYNILLVSRSKVVR